MSAKAYGLAIGLNSVDPQHYAGWSGPLEACEADARDMANLMGGLGFAHISVALTKTATRSIVLYELQDVAKKAVSGDLVVITNSSHGGQLPDLDGDEADGMDETWCLYDGEITDDELYRAYAAFAPGVRVLVLSDSCHSGTVIRARQAYEMAHGKLMPRDVGTSTYLQNKAFYDAILTQPKPTRGVDASVLLISGCLDNEVSYDGARNGAFTGALKSVWNGGKFKGGYGAFKSAIARQLVGQQTPGYVYTGAKCPTFWAQKPFTI